MAHTHTHTQNTHKQQKPNSATNHNVFPGIAYLEVYYKGDNVLFSKKNWDSPKSCILGPFTKDMLIKIHDITNKARKKTEKSKDIKKIPVISLDFDSQKR